MNIAGNMTDSKMFLGIRRDVWDRIKKMKLLYILLLLPIIHTVIFKYIPMYGLIIAFKDYKISQGMLGSPWNNFEHFKFLFENPGFMRIMRNTINISLQKTVFAFLADIGFALLLNEIINLKYKKIVQSVSYLPHFMSWVVIGGMLREILSPSSGIVNAFLVALGLETVNFLTEPSLFVPILILSSLWQGVGWGSIIFIATLSSVSPNLYEAAEIDGATRFKKAIYISLPSIVPVAVILIILRMGNILSAGFEQVFNLYNPMVYDVADIIDTYMYRVGLVQMKYDFGTAVGLFRNVVGLILVLISNFIAKRFTDYGIW